MMNESSFEVEVKIPIADPESIRASLLELGAVRGHKESQTDIYFGHPCRSFPETDEALRLRRREILSEAHHGNDDNRVQRHELTYKGPKIDPLSKTRVEVSLEFDDYPSAERILTHLGFTKIVEIAKDRSFYEVREITVSVDDVSGVGSFLELEQIVDDRTNIESVREEIFSVVKSLGLDPNQSIRTSYLEIYLEKNTI
ncbi:MAG: class IV adenylate cyclase [Candidatus Hodarchaeota archaeon]